MQRGNCEGTADVFAVLLLDSARVSCEQRLHQRLRRAKARGHVQRQDITLRSVAAGEWERA